MIHMSHRREDATELMQTKVPGDSFALQALTFRLLRVRSHKHSHSMGQMKLANVRRYVTRVTKDSSS